MLGINLQNIDAAFGGNRPGGGGYVIEITGIQNNAAKQYIDIEYDIAEGPFKGYYREMKSKRGWSPSSFRKYYTEKALPFFLEFMEQIEDYNGGVPGLLVEIEGENGEPQKDVDETKLPGCFIGMVVGMEEYIGNDGKVKTRFDHFGAEFCDPKKIRDGEYVVPDLKQATDTAAQAVKAGVVDTTEQLRDDDVPF